MIKSRSPNQSACWVRDAMIDLNGARSALENLKLARSNQGNLCDSTIMRIERLIRDVEKYNASEDEHNRTGDIRARGVNKQDICDAWNKYRGGKELPLGDAFLFASGYSAGNNYALRVLGIELPDQGTPNPT